MYFIVILNNKFTLKSFIYWYFN